MSSYMKTHAQPLLAYLHLWYLRALALAWDLTLDGISDEKNWFVQYIPFPCVLSRVPALTE